MSLKASFEFLFVGRDENSFLECYSYDLFEDHGVGSGQIFINLEIVNNPVDAEEIGAVLFDAVRDVFFADLTKDGNSRFEAALKAANKALNDFKVTKVTEYLGNLNVIVGAVLDNQLFLSQSGDSEAYLIRKRFVSVVSEGLSDEKSDDEIFSSIASGVIEAGDFVLFSSTRLLRYIGKTDLAACVVSNNLVETLAEIKDRVAVEILGRIGLTGMMFVKEDVVEQGLLSESGDEEVLVKEPKERGEVVKASRRQGGKKGAMEFVSNFLNVVKGYGKKMKGGNVDRLMRGVNARVLSKGVAKDKILAVLVGVIVVLFVGVFLASGHRAQRAEIERLDVVLKSVQERVSEAQTKAALDKDVAKNLLNLAYADAKSVLDSGIYREKATLLLMDIEGTLDSLDDVQRIESPMMVADLTSKKSNVNALGFAVLRDRVFVYDKDSVFEILADQVSDPIVLDKEEVIVAGSGFTDNNSLVFLTRSGNLLRYQDGNVTFMNTDDGTFRRGIEMADFGSRIYVLDDSEGQIWRYGYQGSRSRFGESDNYVVDDTKIANVKDLAIDGGVFVLSGEGVISRFYAGENQKFFINNAPFNSFVDPVKIYTNEQLSELFVLDGSEKKVFVYLKDSRTGNLVYSNQYLFEVEGELRDLYVDSAKRILYVLSNDKVYRHEL